MLVLFCYKTTTLPASSGRSAGKLTRSARKPCRRLVESSPEKSSGSRRFHRPLDRKPGITVEHGGYIPPHEAAGTKQTDVGGWVLRTQHHPSETVVVLVAGRTLGRRQQHTRRRERDRRSTRSRRDTGGRTWLLVAGARCQSVGCGSLLTATRLVSF